MKKICIIFFCLSFLASLAFAQDVYVNGYFRSDGTYVRPHYRTAPNGNPWDNYSTKGNINPYTGKIGTKLPYKNSFGSTWPSYSPLSKPSYKLYR